MADDRITIGVTHEATIEGERAWIKFEYSTDIPTADDRDVYIDDANRLVQEKIIEIIEKTAETKMNYGK